MTVTNENRSVTYDGDGSTTVFPVANDGVIYFLQASDLLVTLIDADGVDHVQALTTDYTVSGAGNADGGSVTMLTAPAAGERLRIERWVDILQPTNYPENTKFPAASHERALDRLTMIDQQQQGEIDRAPKFSETSGYKNVELPAPENGKGIKFDAETGNYINTTFDPDQAQADAEAAKEAAEAAQEGAEEALASFNEKYIGAFANDAAATAAAGGSPVIGALYWNTGNEILRIWTGSVWSDAGTGDMLQSVYDPEGVGGDVFDGGNTHDGTITEQKLAFPLIARIGPWTLKAFNQGAGVGNEAADTIALTNALASGETEIVIDAVQFEIEAGNYAVPAGTTIKGQGKASVLHCADPALNVALLRIASDVRLADFVLRGPQDTVSTYVAGQHGIDTGDTGSDIENVRFRDMEIYGFADRGITGHRMKGMRSWGTHVHDVGRAGWLMVGGEDCAHFGDVVETVKPGNSGNTPFINAYGFQYGNDGATTGFPRPKNIQLYGCGVRDIPTWTGFDSHGVDGMHLHGCWTYEVCNPVYFGPSSGTNNDPNTNSSIIGGRFEAGSLTFTRAAIIVSKAAGDHGGDGVRIVAPYIDGHGLNQAAYDTGNYNREGAIYLAYVSGVTIEGPVIRNWHQSAICLRREVENTRISGHNIHNGNASNGIMNAIDIVESQNIDATIGRGTIKRTGGAMVGIAVGGSAPSGIYGPKVHKQDMIGVPTPISGFNLLHPTSEFELVGSVTTDLASIAAGATATFSISVPGASVGDRVAWATHNGSHLLTFDMSRCYVQAADSVRVTVYNPTGSAIDAPSTIYSVAVVKAGIRP